MATHTHRTGSSGQPPRIMAKLNGLFEWLRRNHDPVVAVCTVLILLVTAAYASLALLQWTAMRESNEFNRKSMYAVQRPFLVFEGVSQLIGNVPNRDNKGAKAIQMYAKWRNVGNTPAIDVFTLIGIASEQHQEPTENMFLGVGINQDLKAAPAGPREEFDSRDMYEPMSFADVGKQEDDRYIWGWTVYRDAFPGTPEHVTEFCTRIDSIAKSKDKYVFGADLCGAHNCMDDTCQDYKSILGRVAHR